MDILIVLDRQRGNATRDMLNDDVDRIRPHHRIVGSGVNTVQGPDERPNRQHQNDDQNTGDSARSFRIPTDQFTQP